MSFRFVPLGVGDAFSELRYSSCVALEHDGELLLIDCPHPILKILREAREATGLALSADRIRGVVLTHLHADHASGLEGLAYFCHFAFGRKLELLVHPAVHARLWDGHLAAGMEQLLPAVGADFVRKEERDFLDVVPLDEGGAIACGPFSVECRRTIHHIPTFAVRVTAGGKRLGHSADTAFDPGLIDWLAESDLFIHETNYGVHTPYASLAALPAELRAKMRLTHYPDGFDLEGSVIEPLLERRVYQVG